MDYLIATDCETGGLDPNESDLLTIYMAVVDQDNKIVEELDLLLKPDDRLPIAHEDALKVTGIDLKAHLANPSTITYSEAKEKIMTMLKKYRKGGRYSNIRLFGFNVRFDRDFINKHLIPKSEFEKLVHYKVIDTMDGVDFLKRHKWLPPQVGNLSSCVDHFGLAKGKAHTAKDDVLMTLEIEKKIKEIMDSKKEGGQSFDLISLLEAE